MIWTASRRCYQRNPWKPGTKAGEFFKRYEVGLTVRELVKDRKVPRAYIAWDVCRGYVSVATAAPEPEA